MKKSKNEDFVLKIKNNMGEEIEYPMKYVEPGTFMMGSEKHTFSQPAIEINIKRGFYIGQYPVTQALWEAVMDGKNSSNYKGDSRPVESIYWDMVQDFIRKLNSQLNNQFQFRLPSESEWEFAALGGEEGAKEDLIYSGSNRIEEVAWYKENSNSNTKPVGLKMPNQLDLYDMSGNVWEWCEDDWVENYDMLPRDGSAFLHDKKTKNEIHLKVVRGGSWLNNGNYCAVRIRDRSNLDGRDYDVGFRLARY